VHWAGGEIAESVMSGVVAPSSQAVAFLATTQVAALANWWFTALGRSPQKRSPLTPLAKTSITPVPGLTMTLHFVTAPAFAVVHPTNSATAGTRSLRLWLMTPPFDPEA
jgi:hypothetical protein